MTVYRSVRASQSNEPAAVRRAEARQRCDSTAPDRFADQTEPVIMCVTVDRSESMARVGGGPASGAASEVAVPHVS